MPSRDERRPALYPAQRPRYTRRMSSSPPPGRTSPWRRIFEQVRTAVGARRDAHGALGSINWLRYRMKERGANPNVVRNIIYRDKGKPADKRVLFELLNELWTEGGREPLQVPEIEVLLSPQGSVEQEALQLMGREKRRAFRSFVGAIGDGGHPKLLVTGRPGSGKTMLMDYVQQALRVSDAGGDVIRMEFGGGELATSIVQLGEALGAPRGAIDARLAKLGIAGAFAVQADAQSDLVRTVLDAARQRQEHATLLLHVSHGLAERDTLANVPLRLNTPDVPRVSALDWLWTMLLAPLAGAAKLAVLVSMTDLPARAAAGAPGYDGPLKLTPPTAPEARRFVKGRLPHLPVPRHEEIVQQAGRSFEELRTLTLLAEVRAPIPRHDPEASIARLAELGTAGHDTRLRDFLSAVAILSLPEYPTFELADVEALRPTEQAGTSSSELAFLDPVPGATGRYRCFSRTLVRALRERLAVHDEARYRSLHRAAADRFRSGAARDPRGEAAVRRLHHLFHARDWAGMVAFMEAYGVQQSLVGTLWHLAREQLPAADRELFEAVAEQVADHYVQLGAHRHPAADEACAALAESARPQRRAWATLKQAEASILRGEHDAAIARLRDWPRSDDPVLESEACLVQASIERWRGDLSRAAEHVERARTLVRTMANVLPAERLAQAKVALWAGVIHKERGELDDAVAEFQGVRTESDLLRARAAFKAADTLMQLGRLDAAAHEFDSAVDLAFGSGALPSERSRYLTRRATLHRRRGDLPRAARDLDQAAQVLIGADGDAIERDFWSARVDDGRALLLLARGSHDEAIELLASTVAHHRAYGDAHGVDCAFRIDRALLRLGAAYAARALGAPWSMPFPHRPPAPFFGLDLDRGRRLLGQVLGRRAGDVDDPPVADPLGRRALLVSSLIEPPELAVPRAQRAFSASRFAQPRAEARAHLAAAHLRGGDVDACRTVLEGACQDLRSLTGDAGDPGLRAWIVALRLRAHVSADAAGAAMREVDGLLQAALPIDMQAEALRAFGEALEYEDRLDWLEDPRLPAALAGAPGSDLLRPGDLLVHRWRSRSGENAAAFASVA